MKRFIVADLFAGAGGGTTSVIRASERLGLDAHVVAVNHWQTAVETHAINHKGHVHYCDPVEDLAPRECVPSGKLDLLIAGPSCVHFSRARGGEPKNDQQRAGAWQVFRWAEDLNPEAILVENVPEFLSWGPLDAAGRPIKDGLGAEFLRWVGALQKLGYRVEWRVLCAADYGDPTTRKRLFIQATRGPIRWPIPTHCDPKLCGSFPDRKPWRAAEEIIDFSRPSRSIFGRKKPLAAATVARIAAGIRAFWGDEFAYDLDMVGPQPWGPIPMTPRRWLKLSEMGLLPNFLTKYHGGKRGLNRFSPVFSPLATLDTSNRFGLIQPFLVKYYGGHIADPVSQPIGTLTANYEHYAIVQAHPINSDRGGRVSPFLFANRTSNAPKDVRISPIPTLCTGSHMAVVQGFLIGVGGPKSLHREFSLEMPIRTMLSQNHFAFVQPFLINISHRGSKSSCTYSIDSPLTTIVGQQEHALIQPFLTSYYGNGSATSLSSPMPTATGRDRFALVQPWLTYDALDIHLRMLDPKELKQAHSFPGDYQFCGNREDQVKQIGNSWPVGMGTALCEAIMGGMAF